MAASRVSAFPRIGSIRWNYWLLILLSLFCQLSLGLGLSALMINLSRNGEETHLDNALGSFRRTIDYLAQHEPDFNIQSFSQVFAKESPYRFTVINKDGAVLADTEGDPATMENHRTRPEVEQALLTGRGVAQRHSATVDRDLLYIAEMWGENVVRAALPLGSLDAIARALSGLVAGILLLTVALLVLTAAIMYRAFMKPLGAMLRASKAYERGELSTGPMIERPEELATIARAMREMARQLNGRINETSNKNSELRRLFEAIREPVFVIDRNQIVHACNKPALQLFMTLDSRNADAETMNEIVIGSHLMAFVRSSELADLLDIAGSGATSGNINIYAQETMRFEAYAAPLDNDDPGEDKPQPLTMVVLYRV